MWSLILKIDGFVCSPWNLGSVLEELVGTFIHLRSGSLIHNIFINHGYDELTPTPSVRAKKLKKGSR